MKVLFVTALPTRPPSSGGRQRTYMLARAIASVAELTTVLIHDPARLDPEARREMEAHDGLIEVVMPSRRGELGAWRCVRGLHPAVVDRLAHNFGRQARSYAPDPRVAPIVRRLVREHGVDAVVGRYLQPTVRSGVLDDNDGPPAIVDIDDLDTEVYRTRLAAPGTRWHERAFLRRHLRQLEPITERCLRRARAVVLCSDADRKLVDHPRIGVVPNLPIDLVRRGADGADPPAPSGDTPGEGVVLMVGSLSHRVNRVAFEYFIDSVWPGVARRAPAARLRVVGSAMPEAWKRAWARPGVEPVGFVEDLAAAYAGCDVAVAPLDEGGGTKIKVLEAIDHGRPVVVTPHAWRGYEHAFRDGHELRVADNGEPFAAAVAGLLSDASARRALIVNGHDAARRHFSMRRVTDEMKALLDAAVGSPP